MGCSTSSQTSAVDTTRPSAKPEESNGSSTTGVVNENGMVVEDTETIPDQTPAEGGDANPTDEPVVDATSAGSTAAAPPAAAESEPATASPPAEADAAAAPAEAPAADSATETAASSPEPAAAAPEQEAAEATATDSESKTEEAPAPSE